MAARVIASAIACCIVIAIALAIGSPCTHLVAGATCIANSFGASIAVVSTQLLQLLLMSLVMSELFFVVWLLADAVGVFASVVQDVLFYHIECQH